MRIEENSRLIDKLDLKEGIRIAIKEYESRLTEEHLEQVRRQTKNREEDYACLLVRKYTQNLDFYLKRLRNQMERKK